MEEDRPFKHRFIDLEWMQILCAVLTHMNVHANTVRSCTLSSGIPFVRLPRVTMAQHQLRANIYASLWVRPCVCACVCFYLYLWFYFMENQYQVEFQLMNGSFGRTQPDFAAQFYPHHSCPPLSLLFSFLYVSFRFRCAIPVLLGHHIEYIQMYATIAECARMWIIDTYSNTNSKECCDFKWTKQKRTHAHMNPKVFSSTRVVDRILILSIRFYSIFWRHKWGQRWLELMLSCCYFASVSGKSIGMSEWREWWRKPEWSVFEQWTE